MADRVTFSSYSMYKVVNLIIKATNFTFLQIDMIGHGPPKSTIRTVSIAIIHSSGLLLRNNRP